MRNRAVNFDGEEENTVPLTKEYIEWIKGLNHEALEKLVAKYSKNSGMLIFILESLGHISRSFDVQWVIPLLKHKTEDIRFWAVKTLGKSSSPVYLDQLYRVAISDESTTVKREAVSAIGRMRLETGIPLLESMLKNEDPKIVCQAIRGLLVFKGNKQIDKSLKELICHENEMVRAVIRKEYCSQGEQFKQRLPHTKTYSYLENIVVNGDVREVLKMVPEDSIHLTFTSPPYYNARDYSIYPSYEVYLTFLEEVFLETYRVTKEGRFLIVNTSPVIVPRISRAHSSKRYPIPFDLHYYLVRMGWEFIDDIVWEKPEYSVKNRIGGFQQHRKPLAYKPNSVTEYLMVYRKQTDKLLDWNIRQYDLTTVVNSKVKEGFETTNVWKIHPKADKVHSAIFPVELCQRVVEYYSYKGDLVFDPFGGSGTLGRTAKSLGRKFFLTEKESKYFEYMKTFQAIEDLCQEDATKFLTLEEFKRSLS